MQPENAVQLSVIIVNYNVRYFLRQALWSVRRAAAGLAVEIWVVDNHSSDGSVQMVREEFPEVRMIANPDNPGFATANNQAIRQASGKFILLLNPDTLVQEDTFRRCLDFMDQHPRAGALGIRMIDGSGRFLPESKRGFPSPFVAFCKSFGLSSLFPRSRVFNRYHLGYLDPKENHRVEVLAGAFMFIRRSVLEEVGLLDEDFFMYGEDIDLSYRIVQAGYENHYLAESRIIHYKGESTKKGSLNYVRIFYQAMIIFARKHFRGERARLFVASLRLAIYLRAMLSLLSSLVRRGFMSLLDAALIYTGLFLLKGFWGVYHFNAPNYFGTDFLIYNAPLYTLIWLLGLYFSGAYDRGANLLRVIRGILYGTLVIAAVYGFLNAEYRSSRMLIILGTFWSLIGLNVLRGIRNLLGFGDFSFSGDRPRRLLVIGSAREKDRVLRILGEVRARKDYIGRIDPGADLPAKGALGGKKELKDLVPIFRINELIFCLQDLSISWVIRTMEQLGPKVNYKTIIPEGRTIIGSHSRNTSGELYTEAASYRLQEPLYRRSKRVFDLLFSLAIGLSLPLHLLVQSRRRRFLQNWLATLLGRKTWIAYYTGAETPDLPPLKPGILPPALPATDPALPPRVKRQVNQLYAREYRWWMDLRQMLRHYHHWGDQNPG